MSSRKPQQVQLHTEVATWILLGYVFGQGSSVSSCSVFFFFFAFSISLAPPLLPHPTFPSWPFNSHLFWVVCSIPSGATKTSTDPLGSGPALRSWLLILIHLVYNLPPPMMCLAPHTCANAQTHACTPGLWLWTWQSVKLQPPQQCCEGTDVCSACLSLILSSSPFTSSSFCSPPSSLSPSIPSPTPLAESFYLFHFLLFFFTHPLSFHTLSLPHSDLPDAIFPLFFSFMMKSSLGRLLTSFVAFTHTLLLSGFPSVRISTLPFPRLLLSSPIPIANCLSFLHFWAWPSSVGQSLPAPLSPHYRVCQVSFCQLKVSTRDFPGHLGEQL